MLPINRRLVLIGFSVILGILNADAYSIIGWHWYNEPIPLDVKKRNVELKKRFTQLTPTQQLHVLQAATEQLKDRAILSGTIADITAYKKAQDFWVERATQFSRGWQRMLLAHPELDYSLRYSPENGLAAVMQHVHQQKMHQVIHQLAQHNGLLFFYRGTNPMDQHFSQIVQRFSQRYRLALIPVSVDGKAAAVFKKNTRFNGYAKARALGIQFFPSVLLVNPYQASHHVVAYGFQSEEALTNRLFNVARHWPTNF